jgi:hypothetical protein
MCGYAEEETQQFTIQSHVDRSSLDFLNILLHVHARSSFVR